MTGRLEPNENTVAGSADEKEVIVSSSSITGEHQSNTSSNARATDGATPVAPSQGVQHLTGASPDGDHPQNGGNGRGNADTGQGRIEPPDNREKIPQNRECKEAVGYGRPPVASRFRPGKSGNPGGRPRRLPISERYLETAETRLPEEVRLQVEGKLGMKLHKGATFGDALALVIFMSALGCCELGRGLTAVTEIREAVEGKATQRVLVLKPPVEDSRDGRQKRLYAHMIDVAYGRSKLYNMEMPELEKMAKDAGVNLQEAMGDAKPSSPEAPIGDKEP